MKISISKALRSGMAVACLTGAAGGAFAAPILNLAGVQYVQYGDAQSYSLPFAIIDQCGGKAAGCQFSVTSTPGAIKDLIVVATGTESNPATTNFSGMDNAYSTPSGVSGDIKFAPLSNTDGTGTSRGFLGTITNNLTTTWDTSLAALETFLDGNQLVTFFNNNQTNSGGQATQSLAAWAQVWITDANGNLVGVVYDFTNDTVTAPPSQYPYALFTEGGGGAFLGDVTTYTSTGLHAPVAGTNAATDYVLAGGAICRQTVGLLHIPVSCSQPHDEGPVAHNLGADHAAYAILFPELNLALSNLFSTKTDLQLASYTLHVDVRLGCDPSITSAAGIAAICTGNGTTVPYGRSLNNGYEQIFIGTASPVNCAPDDPACNPPPCEPDNPICNPPTVPEPGTLLLAGLALGALGWTRRRRSIS